MLTAVRSEPVQTTAPVGGVLRTAWVAEYRRHVPSADSWARGLRNEAHSMETQERVFRMAEQLFRCGVDRKDLFTRLEEADRLLLSGVDPKAAATTGYQTIAPLVRLAGGPIVIGDIAQPDLRAFGFDPIPFDGHDPAAYAWAMFELTMRAHADGDRQSVPCICHPRWTAESIGLALL